MAEKKSFLLRIRRDLWDEVERMAADEFRSVNAQIEFILNEAVSRRRKRLKEEGAPEETDGAHGR